jgi:hypothetical protein
VKSKEDYCEMLKKEFDFRPYELGRRLTTPGISGYDPWKQQTCNEKRKEREEASIYVAANSDGKLLELLPLQLMQSLIHR